jgi:hypothetical protein
MKNFCKHDRDAKQLTGADLEMQIAYWQAQLADAPPMLASAISCINVPTRAAIYRHCCPTDGIVARIERAIRL